MTRRTASSNPVEQILQHTPDIAAFTRRTGSELGLFATQQNKGDILVRLKPPGERRPADEIINDLRDKLKEAAPRLDIEFVQLLQDMLGDLEGAPTPIEVKVFGDDPEVLADISEQVERCSKACKGVVDLVGVAARQPGDHLEHRPGCGRPPWADVAAGVRAAVGCLARRHRGPNCACRTAPCPFA